MYPRVLHESETLRLLSLGASIARLGDGEIRIAHGGSAKAQERDQNLARRMRQVVASDSNCIIGLPRIDPLEVLPEGRERDFWRPYLESGTVTELARMDKVYGSTNISRPGNIVDWDPDYWRQWREIWEGRKVSLIYGPGRNKWALPMLANAEKVFETATPERDAWRQYGDLLKWCLQMPRDHLFVLSCGPTATILAFDLHAAGYQAIDVGHLFMFWGRTQTDDRQPADEHPDRQDGLQLGNDPRG